MAILGGAIVMRGVDEAVGLGKDDLAVADALKVAAPEGTVVGVTIGAFDEDEEVGVFEEDGVARADGGGGPVLAGVGRWASAARGVAGPTGTTAGDAVRLVAEVGADDDRVARFCKPCFVAVSEHLPVGNPAGLGVTLGIPEACLLWTIADVGAMVV